MIDPDRLRFSWHLALGGAALLSSTTLLGCSTPGVARAPWPERGVAARESDRPALPRPAATRAPAMNEGEEAAAPDGLAPVALAGHSRAPEERQATPATRQPRPVEGRARPAPASRVDDVERARLRHGAESPPGGVIAEHAGVNRFADPTEAPTSTFAIDVDTASYTHARAFLERGLLPPPAAVRVEEVVNVFAAGYPRPGQHEPALTVHADGAPSPFGRGRHLVRVGLQAKVVRRAERRQAGLVFLVDTSGSMAEGGRLEQVKEALRLLVADLRPTDVVGIVAFDTTAEVVLEPTPVEDRDDIIDAIDELQPGGSTNVAAGLELAYRAASGWYCWPDHDAGDEAPRRICRVVLCTDGVANAGATRAREILDVVRRRASDGITLSAIGVGLGNYNDALLEQLADQGDGHYAYVDSVAEARRVFVQQTEGTLEVVARDAKVQVTFDPDAVARYRLLGYEDRALARHEFRDDAVDGGEVGAGHSVTALYEVELVPGADEDRLLVVRARWQDPDTREPAEVALELERGDLVPLDESAPRLRLAAAAARFAEVLRGAAPARDLRRVSRVLAGISRDLPGDAGVAELASLVRAAERLLVVGLEEELAAE